MRKNLLSIVTVLSLSACSLTPEYVRPNVETPDNWDGVETEASNITSQWWENFGDSTLDNLMEQALSNNTNIKAGIYVVEQSRATLKIAGADLWPTLSAKAGDSKTYTNPNSGDSFDSNRLSTGISASYEVDIFGANRATQNSSQAGFLSSIYSQDALKLVIMGEVSQTYFTLQNLRERLAISDKNLSSRREVLRIIQVRVDEGADTNLVLAQQKSLVANAEASRAQILESTKNAKNALAVLMGRPPQGFEVATTSLNNVKIPEIAIDQPSELLERRPDIQVAEAGLIAANADIGIAKAALYPSISLGVDDTFSIAGFGDPSSNILTLAANLAAPIFQGGRLKAGLQKTTARQFELIENYRGAIFTAFQEVEDALAAVESAQEREKFLKIVMQQSRIAYSLSKERYDAGAIDYQTLLDTQASLLSAEDTYAQIRLIRLTASVDLYKAMGGGWKN